MLKYLANKNSPWSFRNLFKGEQHTETEEVKLIIFAKYASLIMFRIKVILRIVKKKKKKSYSTAKRKA